MGKILFILEIMQYKRLHMVLLSRDCHETRWSQRRFGLSNLSPPYGLCLGEVDVVKRGSKELKY